jgi:hypothetical protein
MDIDQRLDKLAERHEALAQSVELLLHTQREAFAKHDAFFEKHEVAFERYDAAFGKNQVLLSQVVESIHSLARIAHAHEQRITGLEDRPQ